MSQNLRLHLAYLLAWAEDLERDGDAELAGRLREKASILIEQLVNSAVESAAA